MLTSEETSGRHLEDLDFLFANKSPFAWVAERDFAEMKAAEAAADSATLEKIGALKTAP